MLTRLGYSLMRSQATMRTPLALASIQRRTFIKDLGLDAESVALRNASEEQTNLELWRQ